MADDTPELRSNLYGWRQDLDELPEWTWAYLTDRQGETLRPVTVWRELLGCSQLPPIPRAVALWLTTWVESGSDRNRIRCWPKVSDIAKRSGWCERTVRSALAELQRAGWLIVDNRRSRGKPSVYVITIPATCDSETPGTSYRRYRQEMPGPPARDAGAPGTRCRAYLSEVSDRSIPPDVSARRDAADTHATPDDFILKDRPPVERADRPGGDASHLQRLVGDPTPTDNGRPKRRARAERLAKRLREHGKTDAEVVELVTRQYPDLVGTDITTTRTRTCGWCDQPLDTSNLRARYCTHACRQAAYRQRQTTGGHS